MSFLSSVGHFFKNVGGDIEHGLEGAAKGFLGGGELGAIEGFVGGAMGGSGASGSGTASNSGVNFQQAMLQIEQSQMAEGDAGIDDWDA
jgi:hypothetical protein